MSRHSVNKITELAVELGRAGVQIAQQHDRIRQLVEANEGQVEQLQRYGNEMQQLRDELLVANRPKSGDAAS